MIDARYMAKSSHSLPLPAVQGHIEALTESQQRRMILQVEERSTMHNRFVEKGLKITGF